MSKFTVEFHDDARDPITAKELLEILEERMGGKVTVQLKPSRAEFLATIQDRKENGEPCIHGRPTSCKICSMLVWRLGKLEQAQARREGK